MSAAAPTHGSPPASLPPIAEIAIGSMVCVIVGVIFMASHLPSRPPLAVPTGLLAAAGALLLLNAVLLRRQRVFAWARFFQVARWALLAYAVIAGMLEYTFVYDHTRGSVLVVMTLMLAAFATNVMLVLAFTVARFEAVREGAR